MTVTKMSKYKLIIFDLDGTLADTSPGILNSIRYVQKMMNLPEITLEQMYSHVGPPMEESYNRNFGLTGEKLKQAVSYHKEYAIKQGYKEIKLYKGIPVLLTELKKYGCKTAIATLKAHTTAMRIFESLNLSDKFDIIKGVDIHSPMTKAQILEYCLDKTNTPKEKAILIGDSAYDAIGAQEVGIDFLGITYGFGFKTKGDVDKYNNIGTCNSVKEILDFMITAAI